VMALNPSGPYPILVLQGEQGSAKSTTMRIIRSIIDPGQGDTRDLPKTTESLFIASQNNWTMSFDNLSGMRHETSDALCRMSTGGAFATRTLYTNDDESVKEAMRPLMFNGINDIVSRQDLLSRCVLIHLPLILETQRKDEADLWERFEEARPRILLGLLKAVRTALERYGSVSLEKAPRLADFAKFAIAAERGFGFEDGAVLDVLLRRQEDAALSVLDLDPVAKELERHFEREPNADIKGTATDILLQITPMSELRPSNWPKTASHFAKHLARITPALRVNNIDVTRLERTAGAKEIVISQQPIFTDD